LEGGGVGSRRGEFGCCRLDTIGKEIELHAPAPGSILCELPVFWALHKTANLLTSFGLLQLADAPGRYAVEKIQLCAICRKNQGKMVSSPCFLCAAVYVVAVR
jgi:hypothetical protein